MLWDGSRGFLPATDPILFLPIKNFKDTELIYTWENFAENAASFLNEKCFREEIIYHFRKPNIYYFGFIDSFEDQSCFERAFFLLSFYANAYVNSEEGYRKNKVPKELSIPLSRAAFLVQRNPVVDYTSYCLYNWRLKGLKKEIKVENLEALLTFTGTEAEQKIICTFVQFEHESKDLTDIESICDYLSKFNAMFEKCINENREVVNRMGNYLFNFSNVLYENWRPDPVSFFANIFFQSPAIRFIYKRLGVTFKDGNLRKLFDSFVQPQKHLEKINSAGFDKNHVKALKELMKTNELLAINEHDMEVTKLINSEIKSSFKWRMI